MKSARKFFPVITGAFFAAFVAVTLASQSPQAAADPEQEKIRQVVRDYLMEHPELVIEAIEAYQANQQEIEQRQFKETLAKSKEALTGGDFPFAGNPEGDIVIVEFFDYNCGYCKRAVSDVVKLLENDDNVKVVFREMPILSETSDDAARYALAAHNQGKYFEYHQALMKSASTKNEQALEQLGEDLGLDVEKLREDAASKEVREEIEKSLALSRSLGIRGTPAFIIGDTLVPGYLTYDAMTQAIEQVRNGEG